jgi:carbon monoxide dehydrogenase subunit G
MDESLVKRNGASIVLLEHSFAIPVGIEPAWIALLDVEQVASCMPGATLSDISGDEFAGSVKVKLGPISLTYKGRASFKEKDGAGHRVVIDARGQDARGNGTAAAVVTATLRPQSPSTTRVDIATDLNITGKPAQFGRGMLEDVSNKVLGQFAECLSRKLGGNSAPETAAPASPAPPISITSTRQWWIGAAASTAVVALVVLARRRFRRPIR